MGLEAPATDVEVRLEDDEEVWGGGDGAGRAGAAAVTSQVGGSDGGAIKKGHVVKTTALSPLHLEVSKHQGEGATPAGPPDAPAALGIVGVTLGVAWAGDLPREPRQLPTTGICKEARMMRAVEEETWMDGCSVTTTPPCYLSCRRRRSRAWPRAGRSGRPRP